jgi:hypothetical protein
MKESYPYLMPAIYQTLKILISQLQGGKDGKPNI